MDGKAELDAVLHAKEVATQLGVCYDTVLRMVRDGDLKGKAVRGRWRFRQSVVTAFLDDDSCPATRRRSRKSKGKPHE